MQSRLPMHMSQRCHAKTRKGSPCQSPAMPNGRCRMHGGKSTGAPCGVANGNYRHGIYTHEMRAEMQWLRELVEESMEMIEKAT